MDFSYCDIMPGFGKSQITLIVCATCQRTYVCMHVHFATCQQLSMYDNKLVDDTHIATIVAMLGTIHSGV